MRETSDEHMNFNCIVSSVARCVFAIALYSSHHIKWVHLHHRTITRGDHNANDDHINFSINIHISILTCVCVCCRKIVFVSTACAHTFTSMCTN